MLPELWSGIHHKFGLWAYDEDIHFRYGLIKLILILIKLCIHNVGQVTTIYSLQTVSCVQCTKSSGESKQGQVEKHHTVFRTKRKKPDEQRKNSSMYYDFVSSLLALWRQLA